MAIAVKLRQRVVYYRPKATGGGVRREDRFGEEVTMSSRAMILTWLPVMLVSESGQLGMASECQVLQRIFQVECDKAIVFSLFHEGASQRA